MSGFPHGRDDMASHPDAFEMRERYARVLTSHDVALVNGPVFLVGLFFAVSPWVLPSGALSLTGAWMAVSPWVVEACTRNAAPWSTAWCSGAWLSRSDSCAPSWCAAPTESSERAFDVDELPFIS
ncbi:hypothetical protein [Streptomyces sp. HC307]|uniref:hypothetical protein n=1 Tax=Streptomyces flavusporus TaxID=3385496 RepID=UPI0039174AD2